MYSPPDRPLIIKCTFDKWHKRITFNSARNCSYDLLRRKVEQCFSLYAASYAIAYKDDDGEISTIVTDNDLMEAIQYFQAGDDAPMSSAASILSGRSFGPRKITLRVNITVDYDGPSLSDTSSLASLEEFKSRNTSQQTFSKFGTPAVDLDDDSVTVSSRDPGTSSARNGRSFGSSLKSLAKQRSFVSSNQRTKHSAEQSNNGRPQQESLLDFQSRNGPTGAFNDDESAAAAAERFPADPSAVFERLKLAETMRDDSSSVDLDSLAASERGAAWLRDQNERTIRSMLGALPEPSDSDGISLSLGSQDDSLGSQDDSLGGDLALEMDPRGKYYYTYTSGSASQFQGSVDEEGQGGNGDGEAYARSIHGPRPTSMQLNWLAAHQRVDPAESRRHKIDLKSESIQEENNEQHYPIDKDLLPFLPVPGPAPEILTDCSNCGLLLDAIRYVCSTCGEKAPIHSSTSEKGKEKDSSPSSSFTYPPTHQLFSSPNSSSSQTYVAGTEVDSQRYKPLPSIPSAPSLSSLQSIFGVSRTYLNVPTSPSSQTSQGYELCSACLESVGINHAIEAGLATPGSSPVISNMSRSHDDERASQWRRAAPKKGQVRHAFQEKVWGHLGWEDVVLAEAQISKCSTCSAVTETKRYKCVSCSAMHLCRACYRQVHELHPSHPFLIVPDKPSEDAPSESDYMQNMPNPHEELSLTHPGVKCAHCLLDIVGARFHCAICDSVDICSNCESAGLPGNLDSADGGHTSSHILIKIPYPLETTELQNASRRALNLWQGRDAASVGFAPPRSKAESEISYANTMIGSKSARDGHAPASNDHRLLCNGCGQLIHGIRYQCAHCTSKPSAYNLCADCEQRSYVLHDPMHIFFKLPRPVNRPLESVFPMLPTLYKSPAGPAPNAPRTNDPKAYLASLIHSSAICDRCMERIQGEWFRCAYCNIDLCDACESVDTHDDTHVFLVFKSSVDMQLFKIFANLENPSGGPPVIAYPVYL